MPPYVVDLCREKNIAEDDLESAISSMIRWLEDVSQIDGIADWGMRTLVPSLYPQSGSTLFRTRQNRLLLFASLRDWSKKVPILIAGQTAEHYAVCPYICRLQPIIKRVRALPDRGIFAVTAYR